MTVKPLIDSWVVPRIAWIASGEARRIAFLPVPGLSGDLSQDLGRSGLTVEIAGALHGNEARDEFLKSLREKFLKGEPADFIADIVKESELEQVLIESFALEESSKNPDEFWYRIRLKEYTEPPEPPGLGADFGADLDTELDLEASLSLDLLDLPSIPIALPSIGELLEPIKPAAENLRATVARAGDLLNPLGDLLG